MTARYRLPDELGGGEHDEYRHVDGGTEAPVGTVAFLVRGCVVAIARALLTEVAPPLPEPASGSAVLVTGLEHIDRVLLRSTVDFVDAWRVGGQRGEAWPWSEVLAAVDEAEGSLTVLVPAPEPVELPFEVVHGVETLGPATSFVKVDPDCSRRVRFGFYSVIARAVEPSVARRIGDAFYAAAAEATP